MGGKGKGKKKNQNKEKVEEPNDQTEKVEEAP